MNLRTSLFALALAGQLAGVNVTVHSVHPGIAATDMALTWPG